MHPRVEFLQKNVTEESLDELLATIQRSLEDVGGPDDYTACFIMLHRCFTEIKQLKERLNQ